MREIKFRGKRNDNGEWVYGVPHVTGISGVYMVWSKTVTSQRRDGSMSVYDKVEQAEVIPETVGQYTEIKDKNGTEIYEGDKVWCRAGEHARGIWEYEKQFTVEYGWTQEMWEMMEAHEIEVIGNIHDNQELMGVE